MRNLSPFFVSISFFFLISLQSVISQTIIPSGYVSGNWGIAGSPYLIQGEITIHADSSLSIDPGVEVIFQGHYPFFIYGYLNAIGTETDSIRFTAAIPDTGWRGLRFMDAADTSRLSYCIIEYGRATVGIGIEGNRGGGIYCRYSPLLISHCCFRNNLAYTHGGAICFYSKVQDSLCIADCEITGNQCTSGPGGGIYYVQNSYYDIILNLKNCIVSNNNATSNGGGIYVSSLNSGLNTTIYLTNCTIEQNQASSYGGGMACNNVSIYKWLYITESKINYNTAYYNGGGIYLGTSSSQHQVYISASEFIGNVVTNASGKGGAFYGNARLLDLYPTIEYSIIAGNQAYEGGGFYLTDPSYPRFRHCTIVNNTSTSGSGIYLAAGSNNTLTLYENIFASNSPGVINLEGILAYLAYSDFYNNGVDMTGNVPGWFGQLVSTNYNGDSCDVHYNIFEDPLFADFAGGDYHLSWDNWPTPDSTKSPCIDAGDPNSPYDPDGTITDLGAFSFDQSSLVFEKEILSGWNLVCLPLVVEDANYQSVFPSSIPGTLYGYNVGYYSTDTLEACTGYWLKFPGPDIEQISGVPIPPQTVSLISGWNIISGLSCDIALNDVGDPGDIIIPGTLFGYGLGYYSTDSIKQGNGYWIKTSSAGYINLNCTTELRKSKNNLAGNTFDLTSFSRIQISDRSGSKQSLYFGGNLEDEINLESLSLPPLPPEGSFDARLSGGYRVAEENNLVVQVQSSSYPLTVKVEAMKQTGSSKYVISELIGNEEVRERSLFDGEEVIISNPKVNLLRISKDKMVPTKFELSQNYPNPFNPSTIIKFSITDELQVNLSVFNILGEKVIELKNEMMKPGYYEVKFDATIFASGVYLYRIKAGEFIETKKMILLK
jgi:predicted outer membrane repeat protein